MRHKFAERRAIFQDRLCEDPTPVEKPRTLAAFLTGRLHPGTRRSELVDQAMHLFREKGFRVAECARSAGVSERRLSQVFREQVGMSPKMWCRIRRFQNAVRVLHNGADVPWAELALRCGYYDQSHFAVDFRAFRYQPDLFHVFADPGKITCPFFSSDFSKHNSAFGDRMTNMTTLAKNCKSTVIPGLRYRNAIEMIDWLCRAFGFEKQAIYAGADGVVMHSQLTFGNGMIMVGSVLSGTPVAKLLKQPDEIGGAATQTPYLVVSDIDAIYASAKTAGAKMVIDLEEKEHGGKAFSCSDPEGHVWNVGTFDPWEAQPA